MRAVPTKKVTPLDLAVTTALLAVFGILLYYYPETAAILPR